MRRLLVASRTATALRLARSARTLGLGAVGVFTAADRDSLWLRALDDVVQVEAYDDVDALVAAALALGADALHPGVGFAAESAALARAVAAAGLTWVGPSPEALELLSDKRALARLAGGLGVPTPLTLAVTGPQSLDEALALVEGPAVLKTVHGGGGRGVLLLPGAGDPGRGRAARDALAALTGLGPLLLQEAVAGARHVEVQALADACGRIVTLGTRECSVQRRSQKLIEEAPAPFLAEPVHRALEERTRALLGASGLVGAATCEFLLPAGGADPLLLEVNARLQVEHAVTEEVTGTDLVRAQLLLAQGRDLGEVLGLEPGAQRVGVRGHAVEARVYAEDPDTLLPEHGELLGLEVPLSLEAERRRVASGRPAGPVRLRTERSLFPGDALVGAVSDPLALLVAVGEGRSTALDALDEALAAVSTRGVRTLVPLLREALAHPGLRAASGYTVTTRWLEEVLRPAAGAPPGPGPGQADDGRPGPGQADDGRPGAGQADDGRPEPGQADGGQPGPAGGAPSGSPAEPLILRSPMAGTVVALEHGSVSAGQPVVVLEAMKMRVPVPAPTDGTVVPEAGTAVGAAVRAGERLAALTPDPRGTRPGTPAEAAARPSASHPAAGRDAASRVTALADPGSLREVLNNDAVLTARLRLDGREALVWAQDPTVRGGTIGMAGAVRVAALIDRAVEEGLPVVSLLDGGGARVQEGVDALGGVGLILAAQTRAHARTLQVGLVLGPAAGGAAYSPALTDVLIMVEGRGQVFLTGPAVLAASTGERVDAQALGGHLVHTEQSGTAHLSVPDEAGAWRAARRLLAWAPLPTPEGPALPLRPGGAGVRARPTDAPTGLLVPEDHAEPYDVRGLLARLVDRGDLLELRGSWAPSVVTALAHVEGVPVGLVATQPLSLAGALTPQASQKVSEHLTLCRRLGLGLLTVVDTPGFLPGTQAEVCGAVRHGARLVAAYASFADGGRMVTLVTRRAYGGAYVALGSKALSGALTLAWPGARIGVMDADSAVSVSAHRRLARAAQEGEDVDALRRRLVAAQTAQEAVGAALAAGWIDEVVAPQDTRARIAAAFTCAEAGGPPLRLAPVGSARHPGDGWVSCACGRRHWGLNGAAGLLVWRWAPDVGADGGRSTGQQDAGQQDDGQGDRGVRGKGGRRLEVLLQLRAAWTHRGGCWGLPGGAVADGEQPAEAALRELEEETGLPSRVLVLGGAQCQEHGTWRYTTVTAQAPSTAAWDRLLPVDRESAGLAWVALSTEPGAEGAVRWAVPRPVADGAEHPVLGALAAVWSELAVLLPQP